MYKRQVGCHTAVVTADTAVSVGGTAVVKGAALVDDGDDALVVIADVELAVAVTVILFKPLEVNCEELVH